MYEKFDPQESARLVLNYLTKMIDPKYDNLPYWLVSPHAKPAQASHCRVDDAELVGSWYEGLDAARKILSTNNGGEILASFRRHVLKSWGAHGLRFHEDYPWSKTNHSSFHEMGYILPALNRMLENNPNDQQAEQRAAELVKGMRSLVIERKVRTFWSGDFEVKEPVYEFPNDVYLKDGGFDLTRHTGRGEQSIRNAIILHSLVRRYEIANDQTALDLAIGTANFLLGLSRYFNYKMEFFGHVHSAGWVASGLVRLGRITQNQLYIQKGKAVYDYIRSLSSSFGWVPEYAQWHPMSEEHCETCCIKDMIECGFELILAGYDQYWNDLNLFARNHLSESQIKYTDFVVVDNSRPDTETTTWRDMDKRMIGGFSGGTLPNSFSLSKFRSIAGCCVGMAPVAFEIIWNNAVSNNDGIVVNIPFNRVTEYAEVSADYPNSGSISIVPHKPSDTGIRVYDWMGELTATVDGAGAEIVMKNGVALVKNVPARSVVKFTHPMETRVKKETVTEQEFEVWWRGGDVVDIIPHGEHLRLYQRDLSQSKHYPSADDVKDTGHFSHGPTQQKR